MSDSPEPQAELPEDRLEAYLDGVMTPAEQESFEREFAENAQFLRARELQGQIDSTLQRQFVAPAPPADILALAENATSVADLKQLAPRETNDATDRAEQKKRWLAVLAACLIWIFVGIRFYQSGNDDEYQQLALAEIYSRCVEDGFRPKWVCSDDREFAETFQTRQGLPLLLRPESQDMMVGLSYLQGITELTTVMLARVEGEPVLVFVDKLSSDTSPADPSWSSGLNLFRKELDELVLYELTPLEESRVLSEFYIPELTDLPQDGESPSAERAAENP